MVAKEREVQMNRLAIAILLVLLTTGCAIRATESDVARWHGFKLSERRADHETRVDERCYSHDGGTVYCYLLGLETDVNYEVVK